MMTQGSCQKESSPESSSEPEEQASPKFQAEEPPPTAREVSSNEVKQVEKQPSMFKIVVTRHSKE